MEALVLERSKIEGWPRPSHGGWLKVGRAFWNHGLGSIGEVRVGEIEMKCQHAKITTKTESHRLQEIKHVYCCLISLKTMPYVVLPWMTKEFLEVVVPTCRISAYLCEVHGFNSY